MSATWCVIPVWGFTGKCWSSCLACEFPQLEWHRLTSASTLLLYSSSEESHNTSQQWCVKTYYLVLLRYSLDRVLSRQKTQIIWHKGLMLWIARECVYVKTTIERNNTLGHEEHGEEHDHFGMFSESPNNKDCVSNTRHPYLHKLNLGCFCAIYSTSMCWPELCLYNTQPKICLAAWQALASPNLFHISLAIPSSDKWTQKEAGT